jgi:hypothetical protein
VDGGAVLVLAVVPRIGHPAHHAAHPAGLVGVGAAARGRQAMRDVDDVLHRAGDVQVAFDVGLAQAVQRGRQQRRRALGVAHVQRHARAVEAAQLQASAGLPAHQHRHVEPRAGARPSG